MIILSVLLVCSPIVSYPATDPKAQVPFEEYKASGLSALLVNSYKKVNGSNYKQMISAIMDVETIGDSLKATKTRFAVDASIKAGDAELANKYINELEGLGIASFGYPGDSINIYEYDDLQYAKPDSIMLKMKLADMKNDKSEVIKIFEQLLSVLKERESSKDWSIYLTAKYQDDALTILQRYTDIKPVATNESDIDKAVAIVTDSISNDKYDVFMGMLVKTATVEDMFNYGEDWSHYVDNDFIAAALQYKTGTFYNYHYNMIKDWLKTDYSGKNDIYTTKDTKYETKYVTLLTASGEPLPYVSYVFSKMDGYWRLSNINYR